MSVDMAAAEGKRAPRRTHELDNGPRTVREYQYRSRRKSHTRTAAKKNKRSPSPAPKHAAASPVAALPSNKDEKKVLAKAEAGIVHGFHKIWCPDCETTFVWSDKPATPCAVCTHTNAALAGSTFGAKRNTFLALSASDAVAHDGKVPKSWIRQYISTHTEQLFAHFRKSQLSSLTLLKGTSGRMLLMDMCRTATTSRHLGAMIDQSFLSGALVSECFVELKKRDPVEIKWEHEWCRWVHAILPRVFDVWNIRPNPSGGSDSDDAPYYTPGSREYSITLCYYQNLGQYKKEPPRSFAALFSHWDATIRRRDLMDQ